MARLLAQHTFAPQIRDELLLFLCWVAGATLRCAKGGYFAEHAGPLREAVRESYPVVRRFLDDTDWSARRMAAIAATMHVQTPALTARRPALVARLRAEASRATAAAERALWVRQLSELDEDTRPYLSDPDPVVRTSAALAPSLAADPAATELIVTELGRLAGQDWRSLDGDVYSLSKLIEVAIARIDSFDRIAAAATTIIRMDNSVGADFTWGPLVRAAFRVPYDEQVPLSAPQRDVLAALVANDRIWYYRIGNVALVFRAAGLPFDREACARILR